MANISYDLTQVCIKSQDTFLDSIKARNCVITGLGNPGSKYKYNRHNIGFIILEALAKILNLSFSDSLRHNARVVKLPNNIFLLEPQTFMNLSGESVASFMSFYKISDLLVIHDDIDIAFGEIRYKNGGSSGGHNGLKSIDSHLNTQSYKRLRFGVGRDLQNIISYVLGDFTEEQNASLPALISHSIESILYFLYTFDFAKTQNRFTLKRPIPKDLDSASQEQKCD